LVSGKRATLPRLHSAAYRCYDVTAAMTIAPETQPPVLPTTLVVMALEIEAQGLFARAGVPVLYTGVGKVNAALALTRQLMHYRAAGLQPPLVLNLGTAGSRHFPTGALVACHEFVQRDMDVSALGFEVGHTPYEELPAKLAFPRLFTHLPAGICGSGDSFETGAPRLACEVVDMEGYALAKVCRLEGAHFGCAKFITDGADHRAATDWQSNLAAAAAHFWDLYRRATARDH
jgi:adenosylhomocysteine nucleosidase